MYDTLQERTGDETCPFLFILNYASVYLESVSSIYNKPSYISARGCIYNYVCVN